MSLLQDTGIVVTACFRARSIHPLWLPDTNQQSYFSNEFISLLLFLGLHWFLPHRWFPGLFWVRRCHCRLKWVKVQKSGLSTCQPSQFYLYSPKSQSLLPWKASLVLRHRKKRKPNNRCGVKQYNYKCTSFIYSKSARCHTYIALIS